MPVDVYVTSLGSLTVAVGPDRFLVEDPESNGILSLHPAFTPLNASAPNRFARVEGFETHSDHLTVTWEPVAGVQAASTVVSIAPRHLRIECRFARVAEDSGNQPIATFHPIFFPAEGPGACALGTHPLRSLLVRSLDRRAQLVRVHGEGLRSECLGAWFAESGAPSLLLAEERPSRLPPAVFAVRGARGRIVSLRVDCSPMETRRRWSASLGAETLSVPALRLVMSNADIREALNPWLADSANAELRDAIGEFDPAGNVETFANEEAEAADRSSDDRSSDDGPSTGGSRETGEAT